MNCKKQIDRQANIISKQQHFQNEREANNILAVLGVPDKGEALDGAITDAENLGKIYEKIDVLDVAPTQCRQKMLTEGAADTAACCFPCKIRRCAHGFSRSNYS